MLIHWDLKTYSQLRIIPTYECTESLVPIEFGEPMPMLNVTDVNNPHVISAGERGIVKFSYLINEKQMVSKYKCIGVLRIWNVKNGTEVFTQTDSLVSQPIVEGAPTITQIEYNKVSDHLYVITFDHNIIVHQTKDLALVKQVKIVTKQTVYLIIHNVSINSMQDITMIFWTLLGLEKEKLI